MKSIIGMVAGVVAAAVGAGIWAAIAYNTGYEIGWIAWIIGGMVGFAVAMGAQDEAGTGTGIAAALIAVGAVLAGKYVTAGMLVNDYAEGAGIGVVTDELVISFVADDIVGEHMEAGEEIEWPGEYGLGEASEESEYPPEIWAEAQQRWDSADDAWRTQYRDYVEHTVAENVAELKAMVTEGAFTESFGLFDVIFLLLAVATAWQLGSGAGPGGD